MPKFTQIIAILLICCLPSLSYAQIRCNDTVDCLNQILQHWDAYLWQFLGFTQENGGERAPNPDTPNLNPYAAKTAGQAHDQTKLNTTIRTNEQIVTTLETDNPYTNVQRDMAKLGITPNTTKTIPDFGVGQGATQPQNTNDYLSFDSLVGPDAYPIAEDADKAEELDPQSISKRFIQFVSGMMMPVAIDIKGKGTIEKAEHLATMWSLVAQQSVGLSNLNYIFSRRITQKKLGESAGMAKKDASPLEIDRYLAEKRAGAPQWFQEMETASPVTLQRETLYVLAQIQRQLFLNYQQNERILATLSASQLGSTIAFKQSLELQKQIKAAQKPPE